MEYSCKPNNLPDDVIPFVNQVAGHEFTKLKPTIGMLKHNNGHVLKPLTKIHPIYGFPEVNFYEELEKTKDPTLLKLKKFVPKYLGTTTVEIKGKDVLCIKMEDITKDFELPCVMDIKIGLQTWEPGSSVEKINAETIKYAGSKKHWGFSIPGFQYHSLGDGSFVRRGKEYGKKMSGENTIESIFSFVNGDIGIGSGLVNSILKQLKEILEWSTLQRHYLFFASSILFAYDAEKLRPFLNANKSTQNGKLESPKIFIHMIDFAHVLPNVNNELDENYITSLERLIDVFENLKVHRENYCGNILLNDSSNA